MSAAMETTLESSQDMESPEPFVLDYLRRVCADASRLEQLDDNSMQVDLERIDSLDFYIDQLARTLLRVSHLSTLLGSVDHLPEPESFEHEADVNLMDEVVEGEGLLSEPYKYRRLDYLRLLLRAMAPVNIDVAALVCEMVVGQATESDGIPKDTAAAAFVLFAVWLPVAPHVAPLVSELFALPLFGCPFADVELVEHRFVLAEAAHALCRFYHDQRRLRSVLMSWWNWSPILGWLDLDDTCMDDHDVPFPYQSAVRWFTARVAIAVLNVASSRKAGFYERHSVTEELVPWRMHPFELDYEEAVAQKLFFRGQTRLLDRDEILCPTSDQVHRLIRLHVYLVEVGDGLVFVKHRAIERAAARESTNLSSRLVRTATTTRNLSLVGMALAVEIDPPPILICGPQGAGKSTIVREISRLFDPDDKDRLLEIHVDDETDTKTLVGSYTTSDIPGEFEWRPGALTIAVRTGKWVLIEDVDAVSVEIQASLVQLLGERLLHVGNGRTEMCHPNFRLFGTMTTFTTDSPATGPSTGTRRLLHPELWRRIDVEPLPIAELKEIVIGLHSTIPESLVDATLDVFRIIDQSGRAHLASVATDPQDEPLRKLWTGRRPSVRDLFKVFSRTANGITFERGSQYTTESQRTLCLAESFDVFVASSPDEKVRRDFIRKVAAPKYGITVDLATRYIETRSPTIHRHERFIEIGRVMIPLSAQTAQLHKSTADNFATTDYALRLMEAIGVSIQENEPLLLVGETGGGKTTILQQMAKLCCRELVVQNLSLQTDGTDLLGGYRPLQMDLVAKRIYRDFVDLFVSTFSRKQNAQFLAFAASALQKKDWKKLSRCFARATELGMTKLGERDKGDKEQDAFGVAWRRFQGTASSFEQQRLACDSGMAFVFAEGALVDAVRQGKWILLDEINLASSETLQRLCGLLDDPASSLTLTERGDVDAIERNPGFRLFAAMNPATDAGKKELNPSVRSRFTELYVGEVIDPVELRRIAGLYVAPVLASGNLPPEHSDRVIQLVDVYLKCRELSESSLVDGGGQRPRYTLRTLSRALTAARNMVIAQKLSLSRALYEGFQLAFEGPLDFGSKLIVRKALSCLKDGASKSELDQPGRRPGGRQGHDGYVLVKPFWLATGPLVPVDWSENGGEGKPRFILTKTATENLRRLARAVACGPWPVLLEGPTSAGKTSLIEYLAARCGHNVIRINNHEHTDIQEYTGGYTADSKGSLEFQDGLLVHALRCGHWVILDELNLAPTEVLEALNRLLDDNRELFLPETNEIVKPHPHFRLFATQNPSGAYGGRKPLSRAFRNRFVELHIPDIPGDEAAMILEKRCSCPPSHAKSLVSIMESLRQRRSRSGVFLGKDGFITPRDLLRWAERQATTKKELAEEGYMLLAERLRTEEEKECVRDEIERHLKVQIDIESLYYNEGARSRELLQRALSDVRDDTILASIAPTRSLMRLVTLVLRCIDQKEPVLLVGDTGCGKTTVVQLLSKILGHPLYTVNCHATTETADLLGGLRPVRGRIFLAENILILTKELLRMWPAKDDFSLRDPPPFVQRVLESLTEEEVCHSLASSDLEAIVRFVASLWSPVIDESASCAEKHGEPISKRQKLGPDDTIGASFWSKEDCEAIASKLAQVDKLYSRYQSLFEWIDGPLVTAMKQGGYFLLDEMSLAEDAVLERLNSVLEPSRTVLLAEKGFVDGDDMGLIKAREEFRLFATMNPGGDFGKRELSPALRNRFTEIWVPPITDMLDIDLVLGRSLSSLVSARDQVRARILEYVAWFNETVCNDLSKPCSELSLSLRDILTWSNFVVVASEASPELNVWELYRHGASLMHLDGLGLGTGLTPEAAAASKVMAESFIAAQLAESGESLSDFTEGSDFDIDCQRFGRRPFWITTGPRPMDVPADAAFHFEAPTTSRNVQRILRALQLRKPVLLEGAPGVGKTSIVHALAQVSGHSLVRINLSEQSDLSDLIGSDLPVDDLSASGGRPSFQWCDGVFLSAIKRGDWVLLDELNLAPQTVLEGLNSCLDHRATVYIPELGASVVCPKSFRVFAAQNPLGQGGGRKGLPKSFLNRFTKVFVDPLSSADLKCIVGAQFPDIDINLAGKMISFNSNVQRETVELRRIGQSGGPWEFNLRDIFRWCQMSFDGPTPRLGSGDIARSARDLYIQRFRTAEDRAAVSAMYLSVFNVDFHSLDNSYVALTRSRLQIGTVSVCRDENDSSPVLESRRIEPFVPLLLLQPFEALARCYVAKLPCLLVGRSLLCLNALVSSLADIKGASLVEIPLSPSSDVSELIGGFEQADKTDTFHSVLHGLRQVATKSILGGSSKSVHHIGALLSDLPDDVSLTETSLEKANLLASHLLSNVPELSADREAVYRIEHTLKSLRVSNRTGAGKERGLFVWKDGALVDAMLKGHWVHLRNANLCPATVLDRLNPVMEPNGTLLLAESGIDSIAQRHRQIHCHPNFRIILSMDPDFGEVSRAMRNRCVEIAVPEHSPLNERLIDVCDISWAAGLREPTALDPLVPSVMASSRSLEVARASSQVMVDLARRGLHHRKSSVAPFVLLAQTAASVGPPVVSLEGGNSFLLPRPAVRGEWVPSPEYAAVLKGARLLRPLAFKDKEMFSFLTSALESAKCDTNHFHVTQDVMDALCPSLGHLDGSVGLRDHLVIRYLLRGDFRGLNQQSAVLDGTRSSLRASLRFLGHCIRNRVLSVTVAEQLWSPKDGLTSPKRDVWLRRLPQVMKEKRWLSRMAGSPVLANRTILDVSYGLQNGIVERRTVKCPITVALAPLLMSLDDWTRPFLPEALSSTENHEFAECLCSLMANRDALWQCGNDTLFSRESLALFQFDVSEFIVLWRKFRRSFDLLKEFLSGVAIASESSRMDDLVESIDQVIFENAHGEVASRRSVAKYAVRPLCPRTADRWMSYITLGDIGRRSSLTDFFDQPTEDVIMLELLVSRKDYSLSTPVHMKLGIVAALATIVLESVYEDKFAQPLARTAARLEPRAAELLHWEMEQSARCFYEALESVKIDSSIETVENQMEANSLQKVGGVTVNASEVHSALLNSFARIQLAALAEYRCERLERALLSKLSGMFIDIEGPVGVDSAELREYVDLSLSSTLLTAADLLPHQLLLWAAEKGRNELLCLGRRLVGTIRNKSLSRRFTGSLSRLQRISPSLDLPAATPGKERNGRRRRLKRLGQNHSVHVPTALLFSFVGDGMVRGRPSAVPFTFLSLENYQARKQQAQNLMRMLCQLQREQESCSYGRPCELNVLLLDVFDALKPHFPLEVSSRLVQLIKRPSALVAIQPDALTALLLTCNCQFFRELVNPLILPLLQCLQRLWSGPTTDVENGDVALANVLLGLLRFHLFVPDSPLDPCGEPLAKLRLIHRRLETLGLELSALRIDSGLIDGDFFPNKKEVRSLLNEGKALVTRRAEEEHNLVGRPDWVLSFLELYVELRDFSGRLVSVDAVLALATALSATHGPPSAQILEREENWQTTTAAFCARLQLQFAAYDDVTGPIVEAIQTVKSGLRMLLEVCLRRQNSDVASRQLVALAKFPSTCDLDDVPSVSLLAASVGKEAPAGLDCQRALVAAGLARISFYRRVVGLEAKAFEHWCGIIDEIIGANGLSDLSAPRVSVPVSDDEVQAVEFKQQFPDYRKEFEVHASEPSDEGDVMTPDCASLSGDNLPTTDSRLLDEVYVRILCDLHMDMFLEGDAMSETQARRKMFEMSYSASAAVFDSAGIQRLEETAYGYSGHVMALTWACNMSDGVKHDFWETPTAGYVNLHRHPNPSEVLKAANPLESLFARVAQLLTAFPGNEILIGLATVVEQVRKLNMRSSPLGKFMMGLEAVLKCAQDWEQHASQRVRIGDPLVAISSLVATWRKIELASWPDLLCARESKCSEATQRHWENLYLMLRAPNSATRSPNPSEWSRLVPQWIWRGLTKGVQGVATPLQSDLHSISDIVKTLDTFVLTASLGDFRARLNLLQSFANQLRDECAMFGGSHDRVALARLLWSMWRYYNQFEWVAKQRLKGMRAPYEEKLKQEARLAKWDEQTYYSLAESTERNHRKLMKVLKEYDEALAFPIARVIDEDLAKGIRQVDGGHDEPVTSVPTKGLLFPAMLDSEPEPTETSDNQHSAPRRRSWGDSLLLGAEQSSSATKMQQYSSRIDSMRKSRASPASSGAMELADLSGAVFARIESLRSGKTTRAMKERAFVDLIKELRRQGFSSTRWSTPKQIGQMDALFQLPSLAATAKCEYLEEVVGSCETYYQRCLPEISRLRAEVETLASRHLTQRQLTMMLSFAESGLFLLVQQRSVLSLVLHERHELANLISSLPPENAVLPGNQHELMKLVDHLVVSIPMATESLKQLSIMVQTASILCDADQKEDAMTCASRLDEWASKLERQRLRRKAIVSQKELQDINQVNRDLGSISSFLLEQRDALLGKLPIDGFDECLQTMERARRPVPSCRAITSIRGHEDYRQFIERLSETVDAVRISVQAQIHPDQLDTGRSTETQCTIREYHEKLVESWAGSNLTNVHSSLSATLAELRRLLDGQEEDAGRQTCSMLLSDLCFLTSRALLLFDDCIRDSLSFHRETAKLEYVLLRVFRVLAAKGYCSDPTEDNADGEGAGGASGMTFEESDGTGLGEGEGVQDVTDELENEEQLLGLKGDEKETDTSAESSKQLGEEEAKKGMEMEADFEGEMFDVPEDKGDKEDGDDGDKEELDREMGDEATPKEEVVDERLWDESDDEAENGGGPEKLEDQSNVQGDGATDEMITKDDAKEKDDGPTDASEPNAKQQDDQGDGGDDDSRREINEDTNDAYEENHGIGVRHEDTDGQEDEGEHEDMDIDDDLALEADSKAGDASDASVNEPPGDEAAEEADGKSEEGLVEPNQLPKGDENVMDEVDPGSATAVVEDNAVDDEPAGQDPDEEPDLRASLQDAESKRGLGVQTKDGNDALDAMDEDEHHGDRRGDEEMNDSRRNAPSDVEPASQAGGATGNDQGRNFSRGENDQKPSSVDEIPNPLKSPGDAEKYWHRKLNIVQSQIDGAEDAHVNDSAEQDQGTGDYEYSSKQDEGTTQVLGEVEEQDAVQLEHEAVDESDVEPHPEANTGTKAQTSKSQESQRPRGTDQTAGESESNMDADTETQTEHDDEDHNEADDVSVPDDVSYTMDVEESTGNQVVSDLSQPQVDSSETGEPLKIVEEAFETAAGLGTEESRAEAHIKWSIIQQETSYLSRRLCEKLRLVLEPLVASKLRGDYRSGKRINMKRVIGYIASGYRKDKIWLRRTKPAKRNYRVLVAVDDSESMLKTGAGDMALKAMATLATSMSQLEVGQVGIASFGDEMRLVHPFTDPFTLDSGPRVVEHFTFSQPRTRTALCVESTMMELDTPGDFASMQLVFMISDGRIERDSRVALRRLMREMMERNILLAMIIVEGDKKKDSIMNMKEVNFDSKGRPVVKRFIEDYPFPYYIILEDMQTLPEVLGDAVRQWFEMLARLQGAT